MRGHWRLLVTLILLLVLYALVGFLLVPRLARSAIESYVHKDLGRHIAIAALRFNPFTFTAEMRHAVLTEADGATIASFDRLLVNAELSSVIHWAWTFKEIRIDRPSINVIVNADGSTNLGKLAPSTPTNARAPIESSVIPAARIGVFSVHDGSIRFEDRSRGKTFTATLQPIEFALHDFRTTLKFQNNYQFTGTTLAGERLAWSGQFTVRPLGSSGRFAINELKAATVAAYLQDALPFDLPSGVLDMEGNYRLAIGSALELSMQLQTIQLRDIGIAPKYGDTASPWIRAAKVTLADTAVSLGDRKIAVGSVEGSGAKVTLWRESDGRLNLRRLLPARAAAAPAGEPLAGAVRSRQSLPDWKFSVASVRLRDAAVDAEDHTTQPAVMISLAPLAVTIDGYSSAPSSRMNVDTTMGIGKATFGARGKLSLEPLNASFDLDIKDFDLSVLQPYVAQNADMQVNRGRLSAKGTLALADAPTRGQPKLKLSADAEVTDLVSRDGTSHSDFVSWQSLKVSGLRYQQAPELLSIESIMARKPYGRVIIAADGSVNVATLLKPARRVPAASGAASVATVPTEHSATPMLMRVQSVLIEDGTANFTDHSIQPNFAAQIQGLKGSVAGLSSDPKSRAVVKLEGNVGRYAPVSITGQVNVLSARTYTDLTMSFRDMELSTFNPYSGKFAGYSIAQGKLTTELHYRVENRKLEAQHHIVLNQLEFGAATDSKQAVPLPIKLAVALLKDRFGVIDINLPVTGSLDDPNFRIAPIVWKLFVGLLTKAVTAPFALLGSLFGGGADLAFIDFAPGSAVLVPEQTQKLTQLAKALVERPQLKLDIPLRTLNAADDAALSGAALEQAIATQLDAPGTAAKGGVKSTAGATLPPATDGTHCDLYCLFRRFAGVSAG